MLALDTKAVGRRVRQARVRAGLTQARLAEAAGVTDETVSRIERGAYEAAFSTIVVLARALGVSIDGLAGLGGKERPVRSGSPLVTELARAAEKLAPRAVRTLLELARQLPPGFRSRAAGHRQRPATRV
jgi:transcriptional regulator with XRE-family HTH domain